MTPLHSTGHPQTEPWPCSFAGRAQDSSGCLSHVQHKCNLLVANCCRLSAGRRGKKTNGMCGSQGQSFGGLWLCGVVWVEGCGKKKSCQCVGHTENQCGLCGFQWFLVWTEPIS